jgi:hypothetical protein
MHRLTRVVPGLAVGGALFLAACGGSTVSKDQVQDQIKKNEASLGGTVDKVECPGDMDAKKGASQNCTIESGGKKYEIKATVESVDGDTAHLNFEVTKEL